MLSRPAGGRFALTGGGGENGNRNAQTKREGESHEVNHLFASFPVIVTET